MRYGMRAWFKWQDGNFYHKTLLSVALPTCHVDRPKLRKKPMAPNHVDGVIHEQISQADSIVTICHLHRHSAQVLGAKCQKFREVLLMVKKKKSFPRVLDRESCL